MFEDFILQSKAVDLCRSILINQYGDWGGGFWKACRAGGTN